MSSIRVVLLVLAVTFPVPFHAQPIFDAARSGDVAALKSLLEKDPALVATQGELGRTPLAAAIFAAQREAVRFLVDAGADVNAPDVEGITPLGYAVFGGEEAMVALLLEKGARTDARDFMGHTPLHLAAMGGNPAAVRLLLDRDEHADVRSNDGRTPLAAAIDRGKTECAEVLLSRGADPNARDVKGITPLQRAVVAGNAAMVGLLLGRGADPRARSPYGTTALDLAAQDGKPEIAALLSGPGSPPAPKDAPAVTGPYLGQTLPAASPHMFAPGFVSTERHELNSVFTPDGKEFYFTIRDAAGRWTIVMTALREGRWTRPRPAAFSGRWSDVDPFVTTDGRRLYFCSNRPLEPQGSATKDFDVWMCERTAEGWSAPVNAGAPVNSTDDEFYPSVTNDGTIYVQSRRPGGPGAPDIWRIRPAGARPTEAECLPAPVNSAGFEGDALVAADESWLIVSTSREPKAAEADLFLSMRRESGGWTPLVRLGPEVNSPASSENCPMLSPDGRFLFFSRGGDVYWADAMVFKGIEVERVEPRD